MENKTINFKEVHKDFYNGRKSTAADMTVEKLKKLCGKLDFVLSSYDKAEKLLDIAADESGTMRKNKGFAWGHNNLRGAFYDPTLKGVEKLYVILHEIGHLALGHVSSEERFNNPNKETEANIFACVFLAMMVYNESRVNND